MLGGGLGASVRVWNLAARADVASLAPSALLQGHRGAVRALGQLEDGRLFSAGDDGDVRLWEADSLAQAGRLRAGSPIFAVAQLRDGSLAAGSADKLLRIWPLPPPGGAAQEAPPPRQLAGHDSCVSSLLPLPSRDGAPRCVSGDLSGALLMWDCLGCSVLRRFRGHTGAVTALAHGAHALSFLSVSMDRSVREWSCEGGFAERVCLGHGHWVNAAVALRDGRVLSSGADRTLRLWARGAAAAETVLSRPLAEGEEEEASPAWRASPAPGGPEPGLGPEPISPVSLGAAMEAAAEGEAAPQAAPQAAPAALPLPLPLAAAAAVAAAALLAAAFARKGKGRGAAGSAPPPPPVVVHSRRAAR